MAKEADLELVGAIARSVGGDGLTAGGRTVPWLSLPVDDPARRPDVIVDFTVPSALLDLARQALPAGIRIVTGTTGLSSDQVAELTELVAKHRVGVVWAPNFALGAVLMMHLATICAPFFDFAEVIELHHDAKVDAPSGTAVATAQKMAAARGRPFDHNVAEKETLPGGRGAEYQGVALHSVRLRGLVAHQEVIFGGLGQTLTIRHDTISRESFMPGVLLAIRQVMQREELVQGLERLLGLEGIK
ncbi:MAG TPA: 4-hydroxy-tetrahydrodipicolinate reductase, partial [Dehalococcoidia bacterium]|nr:4-hydroxy-tetrahydrodipicolinate reductase [Dehalococcoidia bacterium]